MRKASTPQQGGAQPITDLDALIDHRERFLTEYQNTNYAKRYRALVQRVREAEERIVEGAPLRVTAAVARSYARLLAYKDEYEVARLYTNGQFERDLYAQFEGEFKLQFHLAPPLLSRPGKDGSPPRKMTLGSWMWPVFKGLAKLKGLRGTPFDIFGYALERRMERELAADYAAMIDAALTKLTAETLARVEQLADMPDRIRGFGHVKLGNVATVKQQEGALLRELGIESRTGEAVKRALDSMRASTGLTSIPVVVSK